MTYVALSLGWILLSIATAWLWHRWNRKTVTLDEPMFQRWLRAGPVPIPWFAALSELDQERLAQLGDEHSQDVCLGIGYAVRDPDIARAGREPANVDSEVVLLEAMLRQATAKLAAGQPNNPPASPSQPTMAGIGDRRLARTETEQRKPAQALFGQRSRP